jgi:hypothetical protein
VIAAGFAPVAWLELLVSWPLPAPTSGAEGMFILSIPASNLSVASLCWLLPEDSETYSPEDIPEKEFESI